MIQKPQPPYVYITGSGPGDPGLLTLKAHHLLTQVADVVVYDRLIPDEILKLIPETVERIYAGKSCRNHHMTQDEINQCLVDEARKGKVVVRLKGGDPFIFGRGGEEAEFLAQHHIPFEIISGVNAADGCCAALGIPLTHRGLATGVRFITGHQQKGITPDLDWKGLAREDTTLVIYMGLANLEIITAELMEHGLPASTPAVAIQEGTTPSQVCCFATVETLAQLVKKEELVAPTLIVIGKVVALSERLNKPTLVKF